MKNNNMTIFAEALSANREFKSARIDGNAVGVVNARMWRTALVATLIPAYSIRKLRYDAMSEGEKTVVIPVDMGDIYKAVRPIVDLIGEVNGDKLNPTNLVEEFISNSVRTRVIDVTVDMAHAHSMKRIAKKKFDEDESAENKAEFDKWAIECERLESIPGNCKRIVEIQSESVFIRNMELALGDAINKQALRPVDEILAEKAKREADRKAKRKANKNAKRNAAK